jgi:hypothetical protein
MITDPLQILLRVSRLSFSVNGKVSFDLGGTIRRMVPGGKCL